MLAEILRREVQLLAPLNRGQDRDIMTAMETVRYVLADSRSNRDRVLQIFRGDQRALGEVFLSTADMPTDRVGPRWECIGYAAFVEAVTDEHPAMTRWIGPLLDDIRKLAADYQAHSADHRTAARPGPADQPHRPRRRTHPHQLISC